jgi:hypothetical protein
MTKLMEQALDEVAKLSTSDQDAIASLILEELLDESEWDRQFSASQEQLSRIAEKVRQDIRAGRVRSIGIDEL